MLVRIFHHIANQTIGGDGLRKKTAKYDYVNMLMLFHGMNFHCESFLLLENDVATCSICIMAYVLVMTFQQIDGLAMIFSQSQRKTAYCSPGLMED